MAKTREHTKFYIVSGTCGEGPGAYTMSFGYSFSEYIVQKFFDSVPNPEGYIYEEFNEDDFVKTLDLYELTKEAHELFIVASQYDKSNYIVITGSLYEDVLEVDFISGYIREAILTTLNLLKLMSVFKDKEQMEPVAKKVLDYVSLLHLVNSAETDTVAKITNMTKETKDKIELDGCDALLDPVGLFKSYYKQY